MLSTSVPGFITKKETAEHFQRSHRQLTRDLSDAMKAQDPKVLDNCRLRTEDGEIRDGLGVTPEVIDQLRIEGKNPAWYLRTSWLEKIYGRRGRVQRRDQKPSDVLTGDAQARSDATLRPDLVHVLRERIQGLERDKEDLRGEMKIKNQQIADRMEREKETNSLIRDLHTLMADLQRRLLLPTHASPPQITDGFVESHAAIARPARRTDETAAMEEVSTPAKASEKGSRRPGRPRQATTKKRKSRRKPTTKKRSAGKKKSPANETPSTTKSRSLWSRLFPR